VRRFLRILVFCTYPLVVLSAVVFGCLVQTERVIDYLGLSFLASRAIGDLSFGFGMAILLSVLPPYRAMTIRCRDTTKAGSIQRTSKRDATYIPSAAFLGTLFGFLVGLFLPAIPGVGVIEPSISWFVAPVVVPGIFFGLVAGFVDLVLSITAQAPPAFAKPQTVGQE